MFLTITIDISKNAKKNLRMNQSRINPKASFKRALNAKKRNLWQKIKDWRKSLKPRYNTQQAAMF